LTARRDYLGQSPESLGEANNRIGPYSYRVGIALAQPIFPFLAERAAVDKGTAEIRKMRAGYLQARLDAEKRVESAYNAAREAFASYLDAKSSLGELQHILVLTRSQFKAGRTGLDNVEHAEMDIDKAQCDVDTLASKNVVANWELRRSLQPQEFPQLLFAVLRISNAGEHWRDDKDRPGAETGP
jgi:outer membrane protein TolC